MLAFSGDLKSCTCVCKDLGGIFFVFLFHNQIGFGKVGVIAKKELA